MWLKVGHWGAFGHTPKPKELSQYLISVVKETKCTPVMNCLCYSAPGGPHLKYDPEPNTYSKNWPTVRRPHACFPLRKSTKATPRSSDTPLHACGIV